jgi:phosphatidate cytidylyltransferase
MTRLLSGVALGAATLAAILLLPPVGLRILACLVAALASREYLKVLHQNGKPPHLAPLIVLVVATCWWTSDITPGPLLAVLLLGLGWLAVEVVFLGLTVDRAAARVLAQWYIGMPLGMLAAVESLAGRMGPLLLISAIAVSDSAQFYTGRLLGRRLLVPAISPKKTVEGAVGGLVLATVFVALAGPAVLPGAGRLSLALLGVIMAVLGIIGDLFESRLKRIAGVKDSSVIIPGHGGILDRIDALLFATPAFYLYLQA